MRYVYEAKDLQGNHWRGTEEVDTLEDLVKLLREKDYFLISYRKKKLLFSKRRNIKGRDLALLCKQFASCFHAGIPIHQTLELLINATKHSPLQGELRKWKAQLAQGNSLWESMKKGDKTYPSFLLSMVHLGEESGNLEEVFTLLSTHYEKEFQLRKKLLRALSYPCLLGIVILNVTILLLWKVVPVFVESILLFQGEIPPLTKGTLYLSSLLEHYFFHLFVLLLLGIVLGKSYVRSQAGKEKLHTLGFRVPFLKNLYGSFHLAVFGKSMAMLLKNGVGLWRSLQITMESTENTYLKARLEKIGEEIEKGKSMAAAVEQSTLFPPYFYTMLAMGEETGTLETMLHKGATIMEEELEDKIAQLTIFIEPFFILCASVLIGGVLLSVLLPMLQMLEAASR